MISPPILARGLAATLAAYGLVAHPRLRWLGTTPAERRAAYPGDDLIPGARRNGAMATTIDAPPEAVWPWLVQMGCDRAGFYSFDLLDNGGRPSARSIHPEWQHLQPGDRVYCFPDRSRWFDVVLCEAPRALVLRCTLRLPAARNVGPGDPRPSAYSDSIWGFHLAPTGKGGTRLLVTNTGRGAPRALDVVRWLAGDPSFWIMQSRQFAGLRERTRPHGPEDGAASTPALPGAPSSAPTLRLGLFDRLINPCVTRLLRSPLHGRLGDAIASLTYRAMVDDQSQREVVLDQHARRFKRSARAMHLELGRDGAFTTGRPHPRRQRDHRRLRRPTAGSGVAPVARTPEVETAPVTGAD